MYIQGEGEIFFTYLFLRCTFLCILVSDEELKMYVTNEMAKKLQYSNLESIQLLKDFADFLC